MLILNKFYGENIMKISHVLGLTLLPLWLFAGPLHDAAEKGDLDAVKALVAKGENIDAKNKQYAQTALHVAIHNEHADIARFLIKSGADVNAKMNNGQTGLHTAAFFGDVKSVTSLLRAKADVNAKDTNGVTPLHRAAEGGDIETIRILLASGAQINAQTKGLATPLHIAAYIGNTKAAEFLIKNGADLNAKNAEGRTALQEAKDANELKTMQVIEETQK